MKAFDSDFEEAEDLNKFFALLQKFNYGYSFN